MRITLYQLLIILLVGFSIFQSNGAIAQTSAQPQQITVAVISDYPPFSVLMPDGEPTGLLVDMWRLWEKTTGTRVLFKTGSLAQNLTELKSGQVDVLAGLFRNEDRAKWAAFSDPIHEIATSIYFRSNAAKTLPLNELSGKRIGVVTGSYQERFLLNNYPNVEVVGLENDKATVTALLNSELDAIVSEDPSTEATIGLLGLRGVLQRKQEVLGRNFVHAMVRKDKASLIPYINDGFKMTPKEQLSEAESRWLPRLETRFYRGGDGRLILTKKESAWIKAHKEITIGVDGNWPPVDFMDNNKHAGITADFLDIISQRLGITFQIDPGPSFKEMLGKVMEGRLKVGATIIPNEERAKKVTFTNPFIIIPKIVVTRDDYTDIQKSSDLAGKTIAIEKGNGIISLLNKKYPNIIFKPFSGTLEALKAVSFGKADAYVGSQSVADWLIRSEQITNLIFVADSGVKRSPQTFAVFKSPEWNPFVGILNKALDSISDEERKMISRRWNRSANISKKSTQERIVLTKEETLWLRDNPIWKIANETDWPPFDFSIDGAPRGFSIDVIKLAASKVDADLAFVNGFTWSQLVDQFKAGELDVLPAIFKTKDRLDFMAFTEGYASNPSVLVVHSDDDTAKTVTDLKGKTVAVIEGYATAQMLKENFPEIKQLLVKDVSGGLKAVSTRKSDAFIGALGSISYVLEKSYIPNTKIIGDSELKKPEEIQIYMAVAKGREIFRDILQKGLDAITNKEVQKIRNRWMPFAGNAIEGNQLVNLTRGEQRWLAEHGEFSLGVDPAWSPFEFFDEDGLYSGIGAGYVDLLSSRLNITLTPETGLSWAQVIEKAKAGKFDILPTVAKTPEREKYLNFTKPYVSFPMVITTRKDAPFVDSLDGLDGKKVGVVKGYVTQELLERNHKSINVIPVKSLVEGLQLLSDGKIDAFFDNLATTTYEIDRSKFSDLKIASPTQYKFELAMAVRKGLPELVPILDKALATISKRDRAAIINSWIAIQVSYGTKLRTILIWAIPIGSLAIIIILIIVRVNRKMSSEISERKKAQSELSDAFGVISDSINYASRIQRSILPEDSVLSAVTQDHFILWEPRDVVGGDIYWHGAWGDGCLIIVGDCTGHGVPGAFMTLIAIGALERAMSETEGGNVGALVSRVHQYIQVSLSQHCDGGGSDDGIELGACYFVPEEPQMTFVGARFELFINKGGEISTVKGTKAGMGYRGIPYVQEYQENTVILASGDTYFLTTDGLIDQVGGERKRMFGKKRFRELLVSVQGYPMPIQKKEIYQALLNYQGDEKRRDDVAVIGFSLPF